MGFDTPSALMSKARPRMSGPARLGMILLIAGALTVGAGSYFGRDAISLYGFIMVACGFVLYMASSFVARRRMVR